jgi:sugar/nucleoside kinase (ribokinase family)
MRNSAITCFGELLVDMISMTTGDLASSEGFYKKFGGAPANTAAGLAKLSIPVNFIGKVGDDPFGHFLKHTLEAIGVTTSSLIMSKTQKTTLAFVSLTEKGDRDFFFYKGAHEAISPREVHLPDNTFLFHFGSLTQTTFDSYRATKTLIKQAKKANTIISYDPNIREALWGDLEKAREIILETAKQVNIIKLSEEEACMLAKTNNIKEAVARLFFNNLEALFITMGENGCYYKTRVGEDHLPVPIRVNVIDTTGAGDAFNAGCIYGMYEKQKGIGKMSEEEVRGILKRAMAIATTTTTKKGAIETFPTKKEVEALKF